ncbi:MAG: HAMP domain-containing histidine kinase [Acidimicrobiales bacterium]|nr:HAMP domain-containing histidine kinase [Acidimicrobiales bacterium]MCB1015461.1 HAMP domain-containing histidine kinase [Acidimicrobiales bacterium]
MRVRPHRPGLRARIAFAFGLGALLLSAILAATTWTLTRSQLLDQRERTSMRQVYLNARLVRDGLSSAEDPGDFDALDLLGSLQTPVGAQPMLVFQGDFYSQSPVEFGESSLPPELRGSVSEGEAATMRYIYNGTPVLAVGVPIPAAGAEYFEVVSLEELDDTLRSLAIVLVGAALLTSVAGATLGWAVAGRALRPLTEVGQAAQAIAGGRLDTRLEDSNDPDLSLLTASFNDMVQALEDRIERDARFASDVSHELRSPLMTLSASIEVLKKRQDEMPERARAALDLLVADVARFERLVNDLLEISRFDAGAAHLELEDVNLAELVIHAVNASSAGGVPVQYDEEMAELVVAVDKRRLERVIANLLDNARKYADGATAVTLRKVGANVQIVVEDAGPGISPTQRDTIFDRFARGEEAGRRGGDRGVGLGLALVAEHVRLHGGRVWVDDRTDGGPGSAFVVELPARHAAREMVLQ